MPYQPRFGIADALTLALSNKPGKATGNMALREGTKAGVSRLGDNFYHDNRFTTTGGATTGGLIGAGSSALNGGDAGQIAEGAGIGAASGAAGTAASNYALDSGLSSSGAGAVGGMAGSAVGLLGKAAAGKDISYDIGPAVAGMLGQAVGGPVLGMGLSKLTSMGQSGRKAGPKFYEDYTWSTGSPLRFENGRWVAGNIKDYNSAGISQGRANKGSEMPAKYRKALQHAHEKRAAYMANFLNKHKIKADPANINRYFNNMDGNNVDYAKKLKGYMGGKTFLNNFNNDLVQQLNGLASGSHVLTDRGQILSKADYQDSTNMDSTGEDGTEAPPILAPGFNANIPGLTKGTDEDTGDPYYYNSSNDDEGS